MLIGMAGLPGSGKSTLAQALGRELRAPVLAVDAVEAALWAAGVGGPERADVPTGVGAYAVVQALAGEMLDGGRSVVVDAVHAVEVARSALAGVARVRGLPLRWIEVVCSDPAEHRRRLHARGTRYPGFREPTWAQVAQRPVEDWSTDRLVLDTVRPLDALVPEALAYLAAPAPGTAAVVHDRRVRP